ncbi:MAG: acetoacetate decarboxylase family protein [Aeromicrobium sp.]
MTSYPAQPWHLTAHAFVGFYLVPSRLLPAPPPGTKRLTIFGRALVSTAFFVYEEPSPLTYNEIMATAPVRTRWRSYVNILKIWVDSEASRDGGRALWAIPKDLADFDVSVHSSYAGSVAGTTIGSLDVRGSKSLPASLPIAFRIAQERDGKALLTKVTGRGRIGVAKGAWTFNPAGPLGYLAERRSILTLVLRPLRITFGN